MRKYTCDMCGKDIDERVLGEHTYRIGGYQDVCQKCFDKIREFINEYRKRQK